jgi:hypothetical protein
MTDVAVEKLRRCDGCLTRRLRPPRHVPIRPKQRLSTGLVRGTRASGAHKPPMRGVSRRCTSYDRVVRKRRISTLTNVAPICYSQKSGVTDELVSRPDLVRHSQADLDSRGPHIIYWAIAFPSGNPRRTDPARPTLRRAPVSTGRKRVPRRRAEHTTPGSVSGHQRATRGIRSEVPRFRATCCR